MTFYQMKVNKNKKLFHLKIVYLLFKKFNNNGR